MDYLSHLEAGKPLLLTLFLESVQAGFPSPATDHVQKRLDLNDLVIRNSEATFLFRVAGDSMQGAGILAGDLVVIDRSLTAAHGDIVLAVIDGEFTLKRLHKKAGVIELQPENPAYQPLRMREGQELVIWGILVYSLRNYRSQRTASKPSCAALR